VFSILITRPCISTIPLCEICSARSISIFASGGAIPANIATNLACPERVSCKDVANVLARKLSRPAAAFKYRTASLTWCSKSVTVCEIYSYFPSRTRDCTSDSRRCANSICSRASPIDPDVMANSAFSRAILIGYNGAPGMALCDARAMPLVPITSAIIRTIANAICSINFLGQN